MSSHDRDGFSERMQLELAATELGQAADADYRGVIAVIEGGAARAALSKCGSAEDAFLALRLAAAADISYIRALGASSHFDDEVSRLTDS